MLMSDDSADRQKPVPFWDEYAKWWRGYEKKGDAPSVQFYEHHPIISAVAQTNSSVVGVIDLRSMQYVYLSPNLGDFLGRDDSECRRDGVAHIFQFIHPDDREGIVIFSGLIASYFENLPDSQKQAYRSFWDFRLLDGDGNYFKILQQDCAFKYSPEGKMEQRLFIASKINNVISDKNQHLRMTNGIENVFYKYEHKTKQRICLGSLSMREMEIARLVAQSCTLKEIGVKLSISFNTVKVHSANIMAKLKVRDSIEMVHLLRIWGFI